MPDGRVKYTRVAGRAIRANAQRVAVEIRYDDQQFRLRVRDDGKGIDPADLSRQGKMRHFGLRGMRERAAALGGTLDVSSEGAGTNVELSVPAGKVYVTVEGINA
jgi:signal transduction histidine kinase